MPSAFFRILLTITSIAPVAFIYSIVQFSKQCWLNGFSILAASIFLIIICFLLICFLKQHIETIPLNITSIKSTDKDMLAFLLTYFLPLLSPEIFNLFINPTVSLAAFAIIFLCVYNSNAFHFNPILNMFGFHFYEVTNEENIPYILITKQEITHSRSSFRVKPIGLYIFLDIPETTN